MKSKTLRIVTGVGVTAIITIGFFTDWGIGTLSAPGLFDISILCPLGALTTMLATKSVVPRALISLISMAFLVVVFGRAFCAWVCPIPLVSKVRDIAKRKTKVSNDVNEADVKVGNAEKCASEKPLSGSEKEALRASCTGKDIEKTCSVCTKKRGTVLDARHFVLGGALVSTLVFGFPVFCLVCPIGLTFATIFLIIHLFVDGDVTWTLVIVPLLLAVEVIFFRKWCYKLCPLSAGMSLLAKINKTFVPTIDDSKCLEATKGVTCGLCGKACEEGIDIRHPNLSKAAWSECSKCRACVDVCPTKAITTPLLSRKN